MQASFPAGGPPHPHRFPADGPPHQSPPTIIPSLLPGPTSLSALFLPTYLSRFTGCMLRRACIVVQSVLGAMVGTVPSRKKWGFYFFFFPPPPTALSSAVLTLSTDTRVRPATTSQFLGFHPQFLQSSSPPVSTQPTSEKTCHLSRNLPPSRHCVTWGKA